MGSYGICRGETVSDIQATFATSHSQALRTLQSETGLRSVQDFTCPEIETEKAYHAKSRCFVLWWNICIATYLDGSMIKTNWLCTRVRSVVGSDTYTNNYKSESCKDQGSLCPWRMIQLRPSPGWPSTQGCSALQSLLWDAPSTSFCLRARAAHSRPASELEPKIMKRGASMQ